MEQSEEELFEWLFENHDRFKEIALNQRKFKHSDLAPIISDLTNDFQTEKIGYSAEDRSIKMITVGTGKTKVLIWSQMHGDEPTATMAIIDILNLLKGKSDVFPVDLIKTALTLYFIPMLNPDGAETYTRRNALGIDLNRDALKLESPEAKLFKRIYDNISPDFAFNLHDQDTRYTVGNTTESSTIAFLAPPYDYERSENHTRIRAMKIISQMNQSLQKYIPNKIAKWPDDFEARAFGDNIQKWGSSTILIESGSFPNDPDKQYIRKLNFVLLLSSFHSIATSGFERYDVKSYHTIPFNSRNLYDLIIRNAIIGKGERDYKVDIGINKYEIPDAEGFYTRSKIEEIGDMSCFRGLQELDASEMEVLRGKSISIANPDNLTPVDVFNILKEGNTFLEIAQPILNESPFHELPINLTNKKVNVSGVTVEASADLILKFNGQVAYAIVNGFIVNLIKKEVPTMNALRIP